jgi:uncharacterized membrane protein (DUF485 family)
MASAVVLVLIGAILCFFGARSVRLAVLAAGFGATWLLADVFGASTTTTLVIAVVGALGAWILTLLFSKFVFFMAGLIVGAVLGAKFFVLLEGDAQGHDWVLAIVFVPAVAITVGFLANRFERTLLVWATAAAGAALVLSGLGRLGTDSTEVLWRPHSTAGSVVFAAAWIALTVIGRRVQGPRRL